MPPKAASKAKKSKKTAKPEWMADDVWAVSQDLPALLNSFAGIKSDKPSKADKAGKSDRPATPGKAGKAAKPEPLPNIPKAQVPSTVLAPLLPAQLYAFLWLESHRVILLEGHSSELGSCRGQSLRFATAGWLVSVAAVASQKGSCTKGRASEAGHCRRKFDLYRFVTVV